MNAVVSLQEVETLVARLSAAEQLQLAARICQHLVPTFAGSPPQDEATVRQDRARMADALLAQCDAAAGRWQGEFDAAADIRQMRIDRDNQICPNAS